MRRRRKARAPLPRRGDPRRTLYLAAYDVRCPARLRDALRVVREFATGGQKSAYECFLTPAERKGLIAGMETVLAPEDSFLLLRLDPRQKVHTLGVGRPPETGTFFYHG